MDTYKISKKAVRYNYIKRRCYDILINYFLSSGKIYKFTRRTLRICLFLRKGTIHIVSYIKESTNNELIKKNKLILVLYVSCTVSTC